MPFKQSLILARRYSLIKLKLVQKTTALDKFVDGLASNLQTILRLRLSRSVKMANLV